MSRKCIGLVSLALVMGWASTGVAVEKWWNEDASDKTDSKADGKGRGFVDDSAVSRP
jgi:hypothetical protein